MNNDSLYILISTIDSRILNLKAILQAYDENIHYVISHQITQELDRNISNFIDDLLKRKDIEYSSLKGKGVAINRNNTLRFIQPSSICLILDDDVVLCENIFNTVLKSFDRNSSADFISFKILDLEGNDYKPYPKEKRWHTLRTLTGIGTTEIAFKSDLIFKNNILFDENFGPGSDIYPIGEDFIFAMDLYKIKTKMLFLPISIVKHPRGSTGGNLNEKVIFGRGAVFARVYGRWSYFLDIVFALKHKKKYRHKYTMFHYLKLMLLGSDTFLKKER